jgi:inner membrane protein
MDIIYSAAVTWFVIGLILFILEFIVPGLILFFFAVGAWVVGLLLLFVDLSINIQLIIFVATSIITIVLFRRSVQKLLSTRRQSSEIEDEFIGKTGRAETTIGPGRRGKISFKGTTWDASSDDEIVAGDQVQIIGNESILLFVKLHKSS